MSTYDIPSRHIYCYDAVNLGAAFSRNIRGPKGKRGRVISISGQITASTTGAVPLATVTTTAPIISVSPSKVAQVPATSVVMSYPIANAVAPIGFSSDALPSAVQRDANNFIPIVPADTDLVFAITAGGAGTADLELNIDWF